MRAPTSNGFVLAILGALLTAGGVERGGCQAKPPTLKAVRDLRIDTALTNPARVAVVLPGPTGEMVVAPLESQGALRRFDSTGHGLPGSVAINYKSDAELRWLSRVAWLGPTLVVADPGYKQLALIDRSGKVTKSLEYPSWVRPAWSDRRKYPLFGNLDALALYPDGSWLVIPWAPKSVMATPQYDSLYSYFMRVDENGSIQRVVARVPRNEGVVDQRAKGSRFVWRMAFYSRTVWDVSADGSRIVIASTSMHGADSASYRVTAIGEKGDTIFSKKFPFTPVPIPKKTIDSSLARINRGFADRSVDSMRALVAKQMPATYAPVENIIAGRDKTVWLQLHAAGNEHLWLGLEPTGVPLGTVSVPKEFIARAADHDHLWGFETEGDQLRPLARYRITPATPASKR